MDKENFYEDFKIILKDVFKLIEEEDDSIISYGILTDPRVGGFTICYNTSKNLTQQIQEYKKSNYSNTEFVRWDLNEWFIGVFEEKYESLNQLLSSNSDKMAEVLSDEDFDTYASEVLDLMTKALLELKDEAVFDNIDNNEFFIYLSFHEPPCTEEDFKRLQKLLHIDKYNKCKNEYLDFY